MAFVKSVSYNYKDILLTEIALDGLQGIGLDLLWKRVQNSLKTPVTNKLKSRYWDFIISNDAITLYLQTQPVKEIVVFDRFSIVDEDTGHLIDPPDYVDGAYEYCAVKNQYGSCTNFESRKLLSKSDVKKIPYEEVETKYGDRLVMVASIEERWRALASHLPITYLTILTPVHYCILELIGRARENGQITVGKTNLTKIVNESKLLFYNRKHLLKLDLIKVLFITEIVGGKSMKTLLLRINKYHKPLLQSLPKSGRVHNMVNYLLKEPGFCERTEMMIKKGFITPKHSKRLQKTFNVFSFEEKPIEQEDSKNKSTNIIKRKFICLNIQSDDDESDDEDQTPPMKRQYKVGVSLMRQAYERFLDAGQNGLTQIELAQLLGVEFYTTRTICRIFKTRKILREFLEDKGRQRTARYVAVTAQKDIGEKYEVEKKKFLNHLNDSKKAIKSSKKRSAEESSSSKSEVPKKKAKRNAEETEATENDIVEADSLSGLEGVQGSLINAKKDLTLRQLMFANGMLKVIKDKQFVIGFQTLGNLVSKEIGQPAMDTKAMKVFIQKLVTDKQLKILKIKWPGLNKKYSYLICAPHIKATDPIVKAKYKEICCKAQERAKTRGPVDDSKPMSKFTYPRYMKIQKLHEHVTKVVYFNEVKNEGLPPGFSTLFSIMPDMTVEYAIGAITFVSKNDHTNLKVDKEILGMKLKDAPKEVAEPLMKSKGLQNSIRVGLKMLATLGLIQIIDKPSPSLTSNETVLVYVFYVNRCAKILDTSGKWPRSDDMKTLEKSFYFDSFDDVTNFWDEVRNISLYTVITVTERERCKLEFPVRSDHEVYEHDIGERYGDGMGPCGFDSSIFMDIPRLWNTLLSRSVRKPNAPAKKQSKKKKVTKKATSKKNKAAIKNPEVNFNKIKEETGEDRRANKKLSLKSKNFTWCFLEDKILTLCKAAIKIISPVQRPGSLTIRNLVAKDLICLISPGKNNSAAHKRSMQLDSKSMWKHYKERILCELRRRRNVIKDYDGLFKIPKDYNPSQMSKLINDTRLPMLELVWFILEIEKNKTIRDEYECIAKDIDDFNKHYTIALSAETQEIRQYKTPPSKELEFGMLKEAILMSIMLSYEKVLPKMVAHRVYMLFKTYSETILRSAIDQLRKGGAIVPRERSAYFLNKESFDTISQSAFKISAAYRRKWMCRLNVEFFNELASLLNSKLPTVGLKGNSELNCLLCELQNSGAVDIFSDSVPVVTGSVGSLILEEQMNVIDMETKYKLKSGHLGWKNKMNMKFMSELFKKVDLEDLFKTMSRDSILTLKTYTYDRNDKILSYLEGKGFKGCNFEELQDHLAIDTKVLSEKLSEYTSKGIIKSVGYFQNVIILAKYAKPFLLKTAPDTYLEPTPWVNLDGKIQEDVFFKWATVILNKTFEYPGITITVLCDQIECISSRSILNICMFLEKCECVIFKTMQPKEIDLFSDDDDVLDENDFSPYCSFDNIYVYPAKDCLTKFSLILPRQRK